MRRIILVFALIPMSGMAKDKKTNTLTADARPELSGIPYALPKTALRLEVQVERVKQTPGRFCTYNSLFFPELETKVDCGKPAVSTAIKGFAVTPVGLPDPNRIHMLPSDGSWRITRSDSITLGEGGLVTGIDSSRQDKTAEIVFSVLGNLATVASKFVGAGGPALTDKEKTDRSAEFSKGRVWAVDDRLRDNFEALPKTEQEQYINWATVAERAKVRAAYLSYLRIKEAGEKLGEVLGGNGAEAAQSLITELKTEIEAALKADFLGQEVTTTWNPIYQWIPSYEEPKEKEPKDKELKKDTFTPFTFASCGVAEEKVRPVVNALTALRCPEPALSSPASLAITFTVTAHADGDNLARQLDTKYSGMGGKTFYYIVPSPADLTLDGVCTAPKGLLCNFGPVAVSIAQWGREAALPDGKDTTVVSLYSASGALQSVKVTSKALLDKAAVDEAFKPVNTVLDATDELNVLLRRQKLAEAAAAIASTCKNLDPKPAVCQQ